MSKDLEKTIAIKSLTRKLIGSILVEDIKDVYSALIYKLELTDIPSKKHFFPLFLKRKYPFTFTLRRAISIMENLSVDIQLGSTLARVSYQTKPKLELELVQLFFSAKLLHSPFERTLEKVSDLETILQPTPKGVAILHWYCQRIGVNQMNDFKLPEILRSNFNSMELISFERDSRTNSIIHNEYWDKLLFRQIMGTKMNTWSFDSGPDPIENYGDYFNTIMEKDNTTKSIFNPSLISENETEFFKYLKQRQDEYEINKKCNNIMPNDNGSDSRSKSNPFNNVSPFFHRFFTNPDSDSHIQYYTSKKGIRFFKSKTFNKNNKRITITACFSGKALVQYLLDCTDIMHKKDAVKIADYFIHYDLIKCCSIEIASKRFLPTRDALYVLTEAAYEILQWPIDEIENNEKKSRNIYSCLNLQNSHDGINKMGSQLFNESNNQKKVEYDKYSINSITSELSDDIPGLPIQVDLNPSTKSSLFYDNLSLATVLKDPGMKHLLRQFMIDNLCVENLNAYDDILGFQSRFFVLKKLLSLKCKAKERYLRKTELGATSQDASNSQKVLITFRAAIKTLCESSLIKVYNIYAMYLTGNAPNELNIDSKLRSNIEKFINDKSNINIIQSSTPAVSKNDNRKACILDKEDRQKLSKTDKLDSETLKVGEEKSKVKGEEKSKVKEEEKVEEKKERSREEKNDEHCVYDERFTSALTLSFKGDKPLKLEPAPTSPTNIALGPTLHFLNEIDIYYNQLKLTVIKIMETDSLNKFLNSGLLNESSIALHKLK